MKTISLGDIDILDVGNVISLCGALWSGRGQLFLVPFPNTDLDDMQQPQVLLAMTPEELERFLHQSDVLDVRGPGHAILRKSQRIIDSAMQWKVFHRDGYACRYCGERGPLTVDHLVTWEEGGPTIPINLLSADKSCNKKRGSLPYEVWMEHPYYQKVSQALTEQQRVANKALVGNLTEIRSKVRSR